MTGSPARPAANPNPTRWWIAALATGVLTIIWSFILLGLYPDTTASAARGYGSPVMAFEMARSFADLLAVFGAQDDPMQIARLVAMRSGNEQDFVFMGLYGGYLAALGMAFRHEVPHRLSLVPVVLAGVAVAADVYENILLFDIQASFAGGSGHEALNRLAWPVWVKFGAIGWATAHLGWTMRALGGLWYSIGTAIAAAMLAVPLAWVMPPYASGLMTLVIALAWLALLVLAGSATALLLTYRRSMMFYAPAVAEPAPAPFPSETPVAPSAGHVGSAPRVAHSATFGRSAPREKKVRLRRTFTADPHDDAGNNGPA